MLSEDNARTGAAIANVLGLEYRTEQMPDDGGRRHQRGAVAASVGVVMVSSSDASLETTDAALVRSRIPDVVEMIRLARAAMANVRQNIAIALGLKAVFLVTSVLEFTGLWITILADTGATMIVTANALRLLGFFRAGSISSGGGSVRLGAGIEPATA
ncbi:hypothetical protein G4G93_32780 [Methylobacterium sp. DB0501]|jgi:Cd2+/Zn2+-exporting ATPase|uniref:hypothetical protein n=1 Tax=Methylobacterium sp. DB0501 TaxID=2709665 RepID=UPI0013EA91D7|nr:hypothetical protein [Methylobacterium sp. DB0501]NGM38616.1 hypothetical protein [Methylobacterium sp. DB0501]